MRDDDEQNKSVGWVALMLALLVVYFGWSFLAADYFQNDPDDLLGGAGARMNFWANSLAQLPNIASVIRYGLRERFWMIGVTIGLEVGVFFFWLLMKKLERELWSK